LGRLKIGEYSFVLFLFWFFPFAGKTNQSINRSVSMRLIIFFSRYSTLQLNKKEAIINNQKYFYKVNHQAKGR
jgi:hypothetical protein